MDLELLSHYSLTLQLLSLSQLLSKLRRAGPTVLLSHTFYLNPPGGLSTQQELLVGERWWWSVLEEEGEAALRVSHRAK